MGQGELMSCWRDMPAEAGEAGRPVVGSVAMLKAAAAAVAEEEHDEVASMDKFCTSWETLSIFAAAEAVAAAWPPELLAIGR